MAGAISERKTGVCRATPRCADTMHDTTRCVGTSGTVSLLADLRWAEYCQG